MRILLFILTSFYSFTLIGQVGNKKTVFKTSYFYDNGEFFKIKLDTFYTNETIDIEFYKKHFYVPYYYPKPFINSLYIDTTLVVWQDSSKEKDFKTNWSFTTVYDKKHRAIRYTYSGCLICSQFPYTIDIIYDNHNRPIAIRKNYGIGYKVINGKLKKHLNKVADTEHILEYNSNNELMKLKCFKNSKLEKQIDKM
jgi:hypothetical protein